MAYASRVTVGIEPNVNKARPKGRESVLSAIRRTWFCCSLAWSCSLKEISNQLCCPKGVTLVSAPELRTFNHPNCWHFRGLQHPRNLIKAFVLTKSNTSEIIEVQLHPRACTDFSRGCRNCLINQQWYARSLAVTLKMLSIEGPIARRGYSLGTP